MRDKPQASDRHEPTGRKPRDDRLFSSIVIVTLIVGIAAMSLDYIRTALQQDDDRSLSTAPHPRD